MVLHFQIGSGKSQSNILTRPKTNIPRSINCVRKVLVPSTYSWQHDYCMETRLDLCSCVRK